MKCGGIYPPFMLKKLPSWHCSATLPLLLRTLTMPIKFTFFQSPIFAFCNDLILCPYPDFLAHCCDLIDSKVKLWLIQMWLKFVEEHMVINKQYYGRMLSVLGWAFSLWMTRVELEVEVLCLWLFQLCRLVDLYWEILNVHTT